MDRDARQAKAKKSERRKLEYQLNGLGVGPAQGYKIPEGVDRAQLLKTLGKNPSRRT